MTDLLDRAVTAARNLPPEAQDEIARVVLRMATDEEPVYALTPGEKAALAKSREQSLHGEYATDEQVQAIWTKHGL
jgi:hypothetical protein